MITLISSPDESTPSGLEEKTVLRLLYATGMRVSELCNIRYGDINFHDRTIRVQGKGRKERLTIYDYETGTLLERYIAQTAEGARGCCYLFRNKETGKKITPFQVARIVKIHSQKNNLHITPHIIRHCFASHMYENGASLQMIQRLLGHSSLQTTEIYIQVSSHYIEDQYRKAMKNTRRSKTDGEAIHLKNT